MASETTSPIRSIRRAKGFTAERLAAMADLASATVYRAERGIGTPTDETLEALAQVLGVAVSDLVHAGNDADSLDPRGKTHTGRTAALEGSATGAHQEV